MRKLFLFGFVFSSFFMNAQEKLLHLLSNEGNTIYLDYLFKGTKIVNSQSVKLPNTGVLQFTIQHRFGTLNSGAYNLYGLDNSQIRLGFDYGVNDWLCIGIGRSSAIKIIDGNSKIRLKQQTKNLFPFTIVVNSAIYVKQWQYPESKETSFLFSNQLSFVNQVLLARKINRKLTLQLSPTLVHYNLVEQIDEKNDKLSLGIGGRQKLNNRITINAEYFYQLNDKRNNNVLSLGFDIETGGHVFQLHLSNSSAMIAPVFITKTTGNWLNADIYFGFNISRVFTINKN